MAQVRLYDLELNIPEQVWSPNTCKTRFALNLKKIPYETKWVNFSNLHGTISKITKSGKRPTVPVIEHLANGGKPVQDSWDIALYLEEAYPNSPSLFHGNVGLHKFFYDYASNQIIPWLFKLCVLHVSKNCGDEKVQKWFRENRESHFKQTLEEFAGEPSKNIAMLKKNLVPIHNVLKNYPYITGDKAGYADIVLLAHFTMVYEIRPDMFEPAVLSVFDDNVLRNWWNRMEKYRTGSPSPQL